MKKVFLGLVLTLSHAFTVSAHADSAGIIVQNGDCIENCEGSQAAVTISQFDLGGNIQGRSALKRAINSAGQVAFSAVVAGSEISGEARYRIVRREPDGTYTTMAKVGMPIQGMPGATFASGAPIFINTKYKALFEDGSVLLLGTILRSPTGPSVTGYVCLTGNTVHPLMLTGDTSPDEPNSRFIPDNDPHNYPYPIYSGSGCRTVVRANLQSGTSIQNSGLWEIKVGSAPALIGKMRIQAPGLPQGVNMGADITTPTHTNGNGSRVEYMSSDGAAALVHTYLEGVGVRRDPDVEQSPLNNQALWLRRSDGSLSLIARAGDPAPGVSGTYFGTLAARIYRPDISTSLGYIEMNGANVLSNDTYAFRSILTDASGDYLAANAGGSIWSNRHGALRLEAKKGDRFVDQISGQQWQIASLASASQGQRAVYLTYDGSLFYSGTGYRVGIDPINSVSVSRTFLIEDRMDGTKRVIAWEGQLLPGSSVNTFTSGLKINFIATDRSSVLFNAPIGLSNTAILAYRNSTLRLAGRSDQPIEALNNFQLYPFTNIIFQSNSIGQYLSKSYNTTSPGLVLGDDSGTLRFAVDQLGRFPSSTDPRLSAGTNLCSPLDNNDPGDFLLNCSVGSLQRMVVFTASDNTGQCPADFNSDGTTTVQDLFDFLQVWFAHDTRSDINGDGVLTVQDLFDFLTLWFAGCS